MIKLSYDDPRSPFNWHKRDPSLLSVSTYEMLQAHLDRFGSKYDIPGDQLPELIEAYNRILNGPQDDPISTNEAWKKFGGATFTMLTTHAWAGDSPNAIRIRKMKLHTAMKSPYTTPKTLKTKFKFFPIKLPK